MSFTEIAVHYVCLMLGSKFLVQTENLIHVFSVPTTALCV